MGVFAPLQAMMPRRFGKVNETEEEAEKQRASSEQEERRRLSLVREQSDSGVSERSESINEQEDLDFSPMQLDPSLIAIQQAQQECEKVLRETAVESLNEENLKEASLFAEQQIKYWAKQKGNASALFSARLERREVSSSVEEEQKLASILGLCREIWMQWDDLFSKIQDEVEKRGYGITTDEDLESDSSSVEGLSKPMASLVLNDSTAAAKIGRESSTSVLGYPSSSLIPTFKQRLEIFLTEPPKASSYGIDGFIALTEQHQETIKTKIQNLLQQRFDEVTLRDRFKKMLTTEGNKFRNIIKKDFEERAESYYLQAGRDYSQARIFAAIQNYRKTIKYKEWAVSIWLETAIFYTRLRDTVDGKVRRFGIRIKEELKQGVRECQAKIDTIESERSDVIDRILQNLDELQQEQRRVKKIEREVEALGQNEVGTTCRVIAGNLVTMRSHLERAQDAFSQYDFIQGAESKKIADEIKQEVDRLKPYLEDRLVKWRTWRERDFQPQEIENDPARQKSVSKMRFMGPLIRKEQMIDEATGLQHEVKMAAEYLMVVLNSGQSKEGFCNNLAARGFVGCRLEVVSSNQSLYRLYFQPKENSWIQTMDDLKKTIQENQLAVMVYPDQMMEIDSSLLGGVGAGISAVAAPAPATQEPWAFYHDKGLHPPDGLFDLQSPLLSAPPTPIKVAIIDTGVFGSIATGGFQTHDALAGKVAYTFDERRQQATGFGFNAIDPLHPSIPEDSNGHGTHVAGIVAASHGVVDGVAGLAGMPGLVQLIICKWIQPGFTQGFCSDAIKCIEYAEQQGAQIINCSWGRRFYGPQNPTGFTPEEVQGLENSMSDKPFLVVASAGNNLSGGGTGYDVDHINRYPCNFCLPNLLSVAGTGRKGKVPNNFSNFGKESVHLAAPGNEIISAGIQGQNDSCPKSGSSQAAPYVTAAAVLAKIKYPFLNPRQLARYLCHACDGGSGITMQVKHGPLNLTSILLDETLREFLRSQKMTEEEINSLLNPQRRERRNRNW